MPGRSIAARDRLTVRKRPETNGVPNRPEYLLDTAEVVAELRGLSMDELAEQEKLNAYELFRKMK